MTEWLDGLQSDDPTPALTHYLRCALRPTPGEAQELQALLSSHLPAVLQCLDSEKEALVELAIDLVKAVLEQPLGLALISRPEAQGLLASCVHHPSVRLRRVVAEAVQRLFTFPECGLSGVFACGHMATVLQLLGDEDTGVAQKAQGVLVAALRADGGPKELLERPHLLDQIRAAVHEQSRSGSVLAMRVLDGMLESTALEDPATFQFCEGTGILDVVVDGVLTPTSDVLLLLNHLTLLEKVPRSAPGLAFLRQRPAVLARIRALAGHADAAVAGFGLRFMARFCQAGEEECGVALEHQWPSLLFSLLDSDDTEEDVRQCCLEAVGALAATSAGLLCLLERPTAYQKFAAFAVSGLRDTRVVAFHALAVPFDSPHGNAEALQRLAALLFDGADGLPRWEATVAAARQFDVDLRMAALHLLAALARHRWGSLRLAQTPGFLAWLTNRQTEAEKEGLEYRYGIGQRMHHFVEDIAQAVGGPASMDLRVFVRLGPFSGGERQAAVMPLQTGDD